MLPKILLVDDREDNLFSLETILQPDGYEFVKANSGRQALKILLKEYDFALILMDVKMPGFNGFETASMIYEREKLKHIPIIFITANHFGEENIYKGYKTGAVDYIYKPINPDLVRAKVAVFIDIYKKNQTLFAQEKHLVALNKNLEKEIADRKISEEKVRNLNSVLLDHIARLESANKDLDNFAFMASHDLQEPLRKIRIFSDRLNVKFRDVLEEDGKMNIERIQKACERMQALIDDILTFSKLSNENKSFQNFDLTVLVNDILYEMEGYVREKKAKIVVERLPFVYGNPGLIRSMFYNLISNALKYSKREEDPVIQIRSEEMMADDENMQDGQHRTLCRIFIEDNGIGFDQQYADQIFGMFKRLHQNSEYEGTGIGLSICKKIAEEHNGSISVTSMVGQGSTFVVSLPASQTVADR
jgi:signal transduction histidine kinase